MLVVVVAGALWYAARTLRARLLPELRGPVASVADAVLVLDGLTALGLLLGTVGHLSRWVFVVSSLLLSAAVVALAGRLDVAAPREPREPREPHAPEPTGQAPRPVTLVAVAGAALVAAQWSAHTLAGLRLGMRDSVDTLWYHGPMSARFTQTGSTTAIHHFDLNPVTAFYPGGTSVLHAEGILLFTRDAASPLLNMAFFGLAFLSVWAIGRRLGATAPAILTLAVVLGTPMLVGDLFYGQPGGEYNDVVALALVLAAVALLVRCGTSGPGLVLAASSAGLAAGSKLSMLAPLAVLTLVVVVLARSHRMRTFAWWTVGALAGGGYWYVRNILVSGSPLPGVELPLGPLAPRSLPSPPTENVGGFLFDSQVRRTFLASTLDRVIGPGWWVLLLLVVVGGVAALVAGRPPVVRALGAVALLSMAAYLVTPLYIGDPPIFFDTSVRFAIVSLVLGPVALAAVLARRSPIATTALSVLLAVVLLAGQVAWRRLWVDGEDVVAGLVALGLLAAGWAVFRQRTLPAPARAATVGVVAVALVVGATWVQRDQPEHRVESSFAGFDLPVLAPVLGRTDARIASDSFYLLYPMYGYSLSNHVDFIGRRGAYGAFGPLETCRAWKAAVNAGRYDLLVVAADHYPVKPLTVPPAWAWARSEVGAGLRPLSRDGRFAATYAVRGRLDPARCPRAAG